MSHSQFSLLATKRFLPLFLTQFLGAFNDNVFKNALIILLTYKAGESAGVDPRLLVTASAGIFILPFFLFSATAGQLADKYEKSRLIRWIKFFEIPVMVLGAAGFYLNNYFMLMAVLFLAGVQASFFGPLKYSILPEHLAEDELVGGNALVEAGTFIAILLGTIAGGILILKDGGIGVVSALMAVLALAGWGASWSIPPTKVAAEKLKMDWNFVRETWVLVNHARKERDAFLSIIGISWFWLVGATFLAQFPVYVSDVLCGNENIVTLLLTVFSVGIALGSLICNKLLKGEVSGVYVPLGAYGMTLGIFLFYFFSPANTSCGDLMGLETFLSQARYYPVLGSLLLIAVFGGIYIVPLYALMQTRCATEFRSRTIAVNNVLNALFMVASSVLTVLLLKMGLGVTHIFLLVGVMNIPVAILVKKIVVHRRAVRLQENV